MAYGNYAPFMNGYYPQQYPQYPQQTVTPVADNTMIWVLGKNEAESYPVAPNNQVVLWDKNSQTIYVKSMSANGVPSIRTLDFTERSEMGPERTTINFDDLASKFVTKDEITALKGDYDALRGIVDKILDKKVTVKKAKGENIENG